MPFRGFTRLGIPDVVLVEPVVFPDHRGFFAELYKRTDFLAGGVAYDFVQVSLSRSKRGVVRGLHYQLKPMEQGKLVTVIRGRVVDVALDIRKGSPWFGKYVMVELSAEEPRLLWIPPGFAHGFQALEDDTLFLYLQTKEYSPQHERCIAWNDPEVGIPWPIRENAIVSEKDSRCPSLRQAETNFEYPI
ncbi:MAG: dTDP-4-dehydrorhamnose 3,5-epimerase [Vulcanisaeta sp.]|uniref:dTDP-4-dehydrorhamnose 3,5-epimerase n=1 Tax=Vulcanisaeta sp. EB80 TaxID=1650660 RepID=UPI0009BFE4A0|nr:dTDP-4-dehydrorhamnose 3,5-epimerase [Vulcanisaeta sp. EB80]MCG2865323.1 dTDP-4-dehydrorhamnose 3,5-epimerase [Vulcanisaeta sp.]PVU73054.1 dTDP-4-dehydrorhamnose 3,5-epimerase [Vulcanisaeta sp. SCGC AB-777_J10]MCG2867322.1 dTDP-4-dehydrorhamnose 3,5-epimerase [Vulcanisaeta sp.]MCG2885911.1 dTDP-4-dehydrorhamnose 3,5-epimerase [Vulcanisaeta sp.]MDT7863265.1 dTDP-4-dehydrorhamnose 3,5-epimerase [Vulcanisaeta sp.]